MTKTILYHGHCADGFGAAWAAWRKLGDDASYVPVLHGAPPPELPRETAVTILDFSYSRVEMLSMRERHKELRVIDHHRTAEVALSGLDFATFDNSKSGAVLAWEHFHPGVDVPELLRYVMDRDLWLHELQHSREVSAALASYPMDFKVWNELDVAALAKEGVPILRYQREQVRLACQQARFDDLAGHQVPVVNATVFGSEIGEALLSLHSEAPFVVIYFDRADGKRQWSLRSREDFDVSRIARLFHNGGHRQAAGFETELPQSFLPKPKRSADST